MWLLVCHRMSNLACSRPTEVLFSGTQWKQNNLHHKKYLMRTSAQKKIILKKKMSNHKDMSLIWTTGKILNFFNIFMTFNFKLYSLLNRASYFFKVYIFIVVTISIMPVSLLWSLFFNLFQILFLRINNTKQNCLKNSYASNFTF